MTEREELQVKLMALQGPVLAWMKLLDAMQAAHLEGRHEDFWSTAGVLLEILPKKKKLKRIVRDDNGRAIGVETDE